MMAEPVASDEPVFVDVGTGTEYPCEGGTELSEVLPATEPQEVKKMSNASDPYLTIQQRRYRCTECDRFTAETEEKLTRHVRRVHRGENPFQCAMCEYSTYNKAVFEEHVRVHQGIKPFKCTHCSYRSASKKNTKKHEQIHRPDNPNRCVVCGFIAKHIRSLQNHQKTHSTESYINQCENCNTIYQDSLTLIEHKKTCLKPINRPRKRVKKKAIKKAKTYMFQCGICKWSGNNKPRILLHLIHHPSQDIDDDLDVKVLTDCGIKIGSKNLPYLSSS